MSAVQSWLVDCLRPDDAEEHTVRVTVRLDGGDYAELREIAAALSLSPTGAAAGLLRSAIKEAYQFLGLFNLQSEQALELVESAEGVEEERH